MSDVSVHAKDLGMEFSLVKGTKRFPFTIHKQTSKMMALNSLNFSFCPGDKIGILGVNGAGKSTLLKIVSGVLRPSYGKLEAKGNKISLLDLNTDIIPQASCVQNIHLRGYSLGLKRSQIHEFEKYVRANADLEKFIHSPFSVLSTGMKTRLLVSMIGFQESEILIMDEWIGTADKSFYGKSTSVLHQLVDNSKVFVLASHNRRIIEELCNRVLVLNEGSLVFDGAVDEGFAVLDSICQ